MENERHLSRKLQLGVRWKLLLPFVLIIVLVVTLVLPVTNWLIANQLEAEADARLEQIALAVGQLIEQSESELRLTASLIANLPDVEAIETDSSTAQNTLIPRQEELELQELSYYGADFEPGTTPIYFGSSDIEQLANATDNQTRDAIILNVIETDEASSGIAITPQFSQIIAAAPVYGADDTLNGMIVAVTLIDDEFLASIGEILNIDVTIVKDNFPVAGTIDRSSNYETLISEGFIDSSGEITRTNVTYGDGLERRLVAHPLIIGGINHGTVLITRSLQNRIEVQRSIQSSILIFVAVLSVIMLVFALEIFVNVANPIKRLAEATARVSGGQLDERVEERGTIIEDEISDISRMFNIMTVRLNQLYSGLEQQVSDRTHELRDALGELEIKRDEALDANRTKSIFLANMSHELRTPLNAIIGYSEMLEEEAEDFGYQDIIPDLNKIQKAGTHLLALINDILDISKIEAGKVELFLEDFDIKELIDEIAVTIQPLIDTKNNQLEITLGDNLKMIHADITKLRQVIFNLLSNSAKFTENGTISITVSREEHISLDWIKILVRDTGIGMSKDQQARVFSEFSQADSSTTRKYGGTGLGLPISRHFCRLMGGDIAIDSEVDAGSTFIVSLPAVVQTPVEDDDSRNVTRPLNLPDNLFDVDHDKLTVLIIDDDVAIHDLLRRQLEREGFQVVSAFSGEEGILRAKELHPNVIALDILMPMMDGWTVLNTLKEDEETQNIPIVILSMIDDKATGLALGAADYLRKPVERTHLIKVLKRHMASNTGSHLLIVEDDPDTRDLFLRTAQREGWQPSIANNGVIGLEKLAEQIPDLILLDLMMPEMDGFTFLSEMKQNPLWQDIPVIVVTAKTLTEEDRKTLGESTQRVVQKGEYTPTRLIAEIRRILDTQAPSD